MEPFSLTFTPYDFSGVVTIVVLERLWLLVWSTVSLLSSLAWWEPLEKAAECSVPELPKVHGFGFGYGRGGTGFKQQKVW